MTIYIHYILKILPPYIIWKQTPGTKKQRFIEFVYLNGTKGFRSISDTAKEANRLAKPHGIKVNQADVRRWKERLNSRKKQLPGYNSFIVAGPYQGFQVDLLFFSDEDNQKTNTRRKRLWIRNQGKRIGGTNTCLF